MTPSAGAWPPPRLGIVGLGLIGRSIALAVRRAWPATEILGVERPAVAESPDRPPIIDRWVKLSGLRACDLIVLAAPVGANVAALGDLAALGIQALITDAGSTKRDLREVADSAAPGLRVVGGHPMAGNETGIPDIRLFERRPWFIVPCRQSRADDVARIEAMVKAFGAHPIHIDADAHDRTMAAVSHLPQLVASLLMQTVGERVGPRGLAHAGRGLVDTTRLASCRGDWIPQVLAANSDYIGAALDDLIARLQSARARLGQPDDMGRTLSEAQAWRESLRLARGDA